MPGLVDVIKFHHPEAGTLRPFLIQNFPVIDNLIGRYLKENLLMPADKY